MENVLKHVLGRFYMRSGGLHSKCAETAAFVFLKLLKRFSCGCANFLNDVCCPHVSFFNCFYAPIARMVSYA